MCPFLCYPRKAGAFHNAFPILGSTGYHLDITYFEVESAARLVVLLGRSFGGP